MKPFDHIIKKALQEKAKRLEQSEKHLKQYLETRDPQIVIDFFFSSLYAIDENRWIVDIIAKWRREGEHELLKKLFRRPPGVKKDGNDMFNLNGVMVVQVDALTSQGLSHEKAFEKFTSLGGLNRDKETVKKAYYQTRKKMYQLYVEETENYYVLTVYNTRVSFTTENGVDRNLFGTYKFWIPRDSTSSEEVRFNVTGFFPIET
jgi:hypothetical protein